MSTEILNVAQRRIAIERGLQQYVSGSLLESALGHWERQYSEKPAFVLNRFLSEICTTDELRNYRKDMLKQVLFELSELERRELNHSKYDEEVSEQALVEHSQLSEAFKFFSSMVIDSVPVSDLDDFNHESKTQLLQMGLFEEMPFELSSDECAGRLDRAHFAQVITVLYQVYCEFYGPTRADQLYARTRQQVKVEYPDVDLQLLI